MAPALSCYPWYRSHRSRPGTGNAARKLPDPCGKSSPYRTNRVETAQEVPLPIQFSRCKLREEHHHLWDRLSRSPTCLNNPKRMRSRSVREYVVLCAVVPTFDGKSVGVMGLRTFVYSGQVWSDYVDRDRSKASAPAGHAAGGRTPVLAPSGLSPATKFPALSRF